MTKNNIFIFSYACTGLLIYFISCKSSNVATDGLTFYYYPQKNVYFDPLSDKYFYSLDGAKTWDSLFTGNENPIALGPKVLLTSKSKDIWKNNQAHSKEYNGRVINIPPGDTLLVDLNSKVQKKYTTVPVKKAAVKKKRGFFQRLFGKKVKPGNDY